MQRIQLGNTLFEGRNDVYVLSSGDDLALVDTGVAAPDTREQLRDGLAEFGHTVADVDSVLLTHWHADHTGLAGEIHAESGATVYAHSADADLIAGEESAWERYHALERRRFEEWCLPRPKREELSTFLDGHADIRGDPVSITPLSDGDVVNAGGTTLETVHLPGHAAGLCGFVFEGTNGSAGESEHGSAGEGASTGASDDAGDGEAAGDGGREAFVGDAILPKYTPNVGGADLRVEHPLATYVESLLDVIDADYVRAWPGHRDVIDRPSDRAQVILDHHAERTRRVVDVLSEHGPCDVWTVSAHLFGELEAIHILHGPGEAWAHLDHLEARGLVERDGDAYALAGNDRPDLGALFPTVER